MGAPRPWLLLVIALLVSLGFSTKLYAGPGSPWVQGHLGDFLYVVFWCLVALLLWPQASALVVAFGVFAVTSVLEVLQLWHPPVLEVVRATFPGHALLGSTFSSSDFPHYAVGAGAAVGIARVIPGRRGRAGRVGAG